MVHRRRRRCQQTGERRDNATHPLGVVHGSLLANRTRMRRIRPIRGSRGEYWWRASSGGAGQRAGCGRRHGRRGCGGGPARMRLWKSACATRSRVWADADERGRVAPSSVADSKPPGLRPRRRRAGRTPAIRFAHAGAVGLMCDDHVERRSAVALGDSARRRDDAGAASRRERAPRDASTSASRSMRRCRLPAAAPVRRGSRCRRRPSRARAARGRPAPAHRRGEQVPTAAGERPPRAQIQRRAVDEEELAVAGPLDTACGTARSERRAAVCVSAAARRMRWIGTARFAQGWGAW
jgi:hypothetical protein